MPNKSNNSQKRRRRSPVPLDVIQKNISVAMAQIIVNMTNPDLQAQCKALLQVDDAMEEADKKILLLLQTLDSQTKDTGKQSRMTDEKENT